MQPGRGREKLAPLPPPSFPWSRAMRNTSLWKTKELKSKKLERPALNLCKPLNTEQDSQTHMYKMSLYFIFMHLFISSSLKNILYIFSLF